MIKKKKKTNDFYDKYNITEEEFVEVVKKITQKLSYKFKFGYHEVEDMRQQATIFALEALDRYDKSRPLENFLWTHVRNRLFNYKRDNYQRPDKPCLSCPLYDPKLKCSTSGCTDFSNKSDCDLYRQWEERNTRKKNLVQMSGQINEETLTDSKDLFDNISNQEIMELLDTKLTYQYREIYLKIKNGEKVLSSDVNKLKTEILKIIDHEHNT
jgi:DNA-directed RNA polymerase specialized sigma24 family protein